MATDPSPRPQTDTLAREVERLLRKLPNADPHLKGDGTSSAARATSVGQRPATTAARPPEPSLLAQKLGVWVRALLVAGFGAAVSQWPYAHACGWRLDVYLGVVATVMIAGAWAAIWAWRVRVAAAHLLALIVVFWGIVLSAEQILPRVGYAGETAAWECAP